MTEWFFTELLNSKWFEYIAFTLEFGTFKKVSRPSLDPAGKPRDDGGKGLRHDYGEGLRHPAA